MGQDFYADVAKDYDRMIRWDRRLQIERPWFESLVRENGIQSVLDAACGSGHHLALLASMGLEVEGTDGSEAMVEVARETTRKAGLALEDRIRRGLWKDLPVTVSRTFDLVLCIGNSLPYVMDPGDMRESVRGLWSRVAPDGILIIQYKNFEKLIAAREKFLPLSWAFEPRETVAIRMYEYHPERIDFGVILLDRIGDEWSLRHFVTPLRPYRPEEVQAVLRGEGATVSVHGSLGMDAFDRANSDDVVLVARRRDG